MLATRSTEQHPEVHAFGCYQKKKYWGKLNLFLCINLLKVVAKMCSLPFGASHSQAEKTITTTWHETLETTYGRTRAPFYVPRSCDKVNGG